MISLFKSFWFQRLIMRPAITLTSPQIHVTSLSLHVKLPMKKLYHTVGENLK